ncbi:MAG: hypothetical protein V1645_01885 [archaeon]
MRYSIYFANSNNLYLEVGFKSRKEARVKLEEIANCFPNDKAVGDILFRNDYVSKVTHYAISYGGKKAVFAYKGSKKEFLKG